MLEGYSNSCQEMGASYMRNYQQVGEKTELTNMGEVLVTQSDQFRSEGNRSHRITLPFENLDHPRLREQRYGYEKCRDVSVSFNFERLNMLGAKKGLLGGRRYVLMKKWDASHITE